ncbi:unannotated protein [freshwater metagenome]|uniref:Unannotated protein n=1 Tax=freshwater metagenome TaxID=449393 RepID=A0A6J7A3K1_9ZZZZ
MAAGEGVGRQTGSMRICVYCGSSKGPETFQRLAVELGAEMASRGIGLVYGGGDVGLMGIIADAVLAGGGEVIGVIPEAMIPLEVAHRGLNELIVVDSMHARKFKMAELSDAFIALPGGFGTLDEIFEILSWNQLGYLRKPAIFLDVEGFWDPMFAQIDVMSEAGLLRPKHRGLAQRAGSVAEAIDLAAAAPPPTESKK